LDLPIPRILSYSVDANNQVGAEYIIEEKANGVPLGSLWFQWPRESQLSLVEEVVDLETKLASISFDKHGCIYYKADLEANGLPTQDINAISSTSGKTLNCPIMAKLAFGPITQATQWEGERAQMTLDRGPCKFNPLFMAMSEIDKNRDKCTRLHDFYWKK